MTPERSRLISELYDAAAAMDPEERARFIEQRCANDGELRRELMDAFRDAGSTLGGVVEKAAATVVYGGDHWTGRRLGKYQLLRLIGEGGMGAVYEAEQDHPRRIVALKVIKGGVASSELLHRFERESQVLARLQHPGIAQIYEAGAAETDFGSQPYFAMEFIHGVPLRQYAEAQKLDVRQRLELMAKVCDAVEHAHQRGVIHRDLKPANILVDEGGQPKILDFGVARATDSDTQATRQTDVGQLIGTLAYMSPEQVDADPLELDTRSDVYALGVILFELLANRLPYLLSDQLHEALRVIREEDPSRLSSISRAYRGDVEVIVGKALEKDKTRRYASAAALADDLRRYLTDQPITARPASTSYQLRKFARRHKALVGAVVAVFVVLTAGIVVSAWQAVRARRAEMAAVEAQQTAQAVNEFLQNDLLAQASAATQSGPRSKPDPDLKVRTALDRAAERITGRFDRQPGVEAAIRNTIGQTYRDLGLYPEARKQLERALELHRRVSGPNEPVTLRAASHLGFLAQLQGNYSEAETLLTQTMEAQRRMLGPEHRDTLSSMSNLGVVYSVQGKYPQAEVLLSQNLEICRRVLGSEDRSTLSIMGNLASVYWNQGKYAQAEALHSKAVEINGRVLGPEHPQTLVSMSNLANDYFSEGNYAQAEVLGGQTLEICRRILGPEHLETLRSMIIMANAYCAQGKYAECEAVQSQAVEVQSRVLGPEHLHTLISMNNLADAQFLQGKYAPAEALFNKILTVGRRAIGSEHPFTLTFLADFSTMYQRQGKYALAERHAAEALAGRRRALGSENLETMASAADLALAYISQGKFDGSEPLAREAFEFGRKRQPDDWQTFRAESLVGASLAGQKKYAEAEPLLLESYRGMAERKDRMGVLNSYHLDRARDWIIRLYRSWGKAEQAAEWRGRH
ncbi:MAG: serine/threonine-protein kinase [Acidobacteriota bacterium]